ncbi:electron transfer flavoprotein subunit alpha/FixB family protein [Criibacterium bergeronii]|uniref:Electron transfer flavoprotein subunit alpha/FixB family protein n=2 Tax=Criibacterium bergeronii TaxID=1871336 RepID=A0A1C0AL89_9FIRM|nr:electron transfer flavoprotein subunit alpha/FixB family protein [Criibacterium bergeronii]RDY20336.1 electron transfer flavoprotein subunit alpha/FixB family protein [Criibacterium bergeronii]
MENNQQYKGVMVYVEQRDNHIQNVSLELLGKATQLAQKLNTQVSAVVVGKGVKELTDTLAHYGAQKIYTVNDDRLEKYQTEPYTKAVYEVVEFAKPEVVLFGATSIGRDLAPRVSARVHTGLTADCTGLDIEEETNLLLMTRPAFGGNIMATIICTDYRPQMSTVRPGVMQKLEEDKTKTAQVQDIKVEFNQENFKVEIVEEVVETKKKIKIEDAKILVSAGRGFGSAEAIEKLAQPLAKAIGGEVSGSRAAVDSGWLEKDRQVGQTGKTVRPNLYFALGISGAIQHLAGMEESDLIIAINKNAEAPIFETADLGIVGDINKVLPELTKLIEAEKEKAESK